MDTNMLKEFVTYLKKTKYKNKIQELKLEYNNDGECPFIYLQLIKIKPSQRCQGYGSAVISDLLKLADEHHLEIRLYATNIYGAELQRLYEFYRKHNFVLENYNNDGRFIYRPHKKTIRK